MLNREKHEFIMLQILKDIYSDVNIASILGFKGGTAAYFFYDLSRFSVDLDFDLLKNNEDEAKKKKIMAKLEKILKKYGEIKDKQIKHFGLFLLLSYGDDDHNIKIEISVRKTEAEYVLKNYLGIPMLVATKENMFANKLIALTQRKKFAARDLYDVYFFLKNGWDLDRNIIKVRGKQSLSECIKERIMFIEKISDNNLLTGLGELIDEKEKVFVRKKIKEETLFLLKAYQKIKK